MKRLLAAAMLAGSLGAPAAKAAGDQVILETRSAIDSACGRLLAKGVQCKFIQARDIDNAPPGAHIWSPVGGYALANLPDLDVPKDRIGLLDRLASYKFSSQLLIYPRADAEGNPYFMSRVAVLKIFQLERKSYNDPDKEDIAWSAAASELRLAPPDSDDANSFLKSIDEQATAAEAAKAADAASKAAEAASAQASAAARAAYLQSPEYARSQLQQRAQNCKKTIAYALSAIARDEKIAAISGYENKLVREQAAAMIVDCREVIAQADAASHKK